MEKLVSTWYKTVKSVPEDYILPSETRPGDDINVPSCNNIPVIDLQGPNAIQEILIAGQEFGFFQVINHGVSSKAMNDSVRVFGETFDLPEEDKALLVSDDPKRLCRLYTSNINYENEKLHYWRDSLRHPCHPVEDYIHLWPEKPSTYREVVGEFTIEVRKLAIRILAMIIEGLGLNGEEADYYKHEFTNSMLLVVNMYPPCPDPSLTLGLFRHTDPNGITILHQSHVQGLQVFKDGLWFLVDPIPDAFVVNIGCQLQVMSNGKLKSAEHRAVTNSIETRTTTAFFFGPKSETTVKPANSLITEQNPQLYRAFQYKEFVAVHSAHIGDPELSLKPFLCSN